MKNKQFFEMLTPKALRQLVIGLSLTLVTGCAGLPPSQAGQMAGTIAGSAIVPGLGAPIGGMIGLLAGLLFQKKADDAREDQERIELSGRLGNPNLSKKVLASNIGTPTRVWVDETMERGRLVKGHFEERIIP